MGMYSLNDIFFTSSSQETLTYDQILDDVQKYCTEKHADKLSTEGNQDEARKLLREFIGQYVVNRSYHIDGQTTEELCNNLYEDMAGISFLKKWIYKPNVEEVNINAFDDIEVIMSGGRSMKIPDRFQSPQHAIDVTRRLLNTCGMVIDDTMPSVIGFLDKNIRISVDKTPIVDAEVGINASIRIVNQQSVSREKLINSGSATDEMLDLLTCCIRYGVSVCIAGSTGSGKTTVMSWLLSMVPNNRRLITIEEGSREFDLIKRDENGNAINSVVHLLTRPHETPSLDIDQDLLLERVLRKHPDVIGVGEMRSAKEALSVAESSRTGHTVVTTIHSNSSESTYRRMMTLAKRKYNMADEILMQIMVEAYPVVVFTKQLEDGSRKIMQIIEGEDYRNGELIYRPLYQYDVEDNQTDENGKTTVVGRHRRLGGISDSLKKRMLDNGIPTGSLQPFLSDSIPSPQRGGTYHAMDSYCHIPADC
jgi:pilus assembly protein CpaF